MTSCGVFSGTATPTLLNAHVVGCTIAGGAACTAGQVSFVDSSMPAFLPSAGSFTAKVLTGATATCADALTALP
jgi:hypothetical protein